MRLNEKEKMKLKAQPTIMVVGHDIRLSYLLGRFAEHNEHPLTVHSESPSVADIAAANPAVIIFLSMELLETTQSLVRELADLDIPIIVCCSVGDETRARELGADYCLIHPLTYDNFQTVLVRASISNHADKASHADPTNVTKREI